MSADAETTVEVRYKITVQRTAVEVTLKSSDYTTIGKDAEGNEEYGYPPQILARDVVEGEIYSQTVSELDLAALVSVVNRLGRAPGLTVVSGDGTLLSPEEGAG